MDGMAWEGKVYRKAFFTIPWEKSGKESITTWLKCTVSFQTNSCYYPFGYLNSYHAVSKDQ